MSVKYVPNERYIPGPWIVSCTDPSGRTVKFSCKTMQMNVVFARKSEEAHAAYVRLVNADPNSPRNWMFQGFWNGTGKWDYSTEDIEYGIVDAHSVLREDAQ